VVQRNALRLDCNSALALDIEGIEYLRVHFPFGQSTAHLNKPIGKRRFTVVNMGDDRKVSNVA